MEGALFTQKVKFPSHVRAVFAIVIVAILAASRECGKHGNTLYDSIFYLVILSHKINLVFAIKAKEKEYVINSYHNYLISVTE